MQVLNYGQSVFEGMKAQRSAKGRIVLFRPDQNAARMADGAARLSMPAPPTDLFVDAVQQLVRDNQDYVPPQGKGSLYIRPLLMGSGGILGLGPAPSYTFAIFCAAVGAYFKVSLRHSSVPLMRDACAEANQAALKLARIVGKSAVRCTSRSSVEFAAWHNNAYLLTASNQLVPNLASAAQPSHPHHNTLLPGGKQGPSTS